MVTAHIEGGLPAIFPAMQKVMSGIANIPKNGTMKFGSTDYRYLKADDVQDKLNPLLTENRVVVAPQYEVSEGKRGNRDHVYVHLTLRYISAEDGSHYPEVQSVGEAVAGDDKSINKALTQAIKNAHRATFQFASGEPDPDDTPAPESNKALDKARDAGKAKTPAPRKAPSDTQETSALKAKIKAAVTAGDVSSEEANAAWGAAAKDLGVEKNSSEALNETVKRLGIS